MDPHTAGMGQKLEVFAYQDPQGIIKAQLQEPLIVLLFQVVFRQKVALEMLFTICQQEAFVLKALLLV